MAIGINFWFLQTNIIKAKVIYCTDLFNKVQWRSFRFWFASLLLYKWVAGTIVNSKSQSIDSLVCISWRWVSLVILDELDLNNFLLPPDGRLDMISAESILVVPSIYFPKNKLFSLVFYKWYWISISHTWVCPWHRIEAEWADTTHHHCVLWAPRHGWWCCWTCCSSDWTWSCSSQPWERSACPCCRWSSCPSHRSPCGPRHCHPGWGSTCLWCISDVPILSHIITGSHDTLEARTGKEQLKYSKCVVCGWVSLRLHPGRHPPSVSKVPLTSLYSNPRLLLDQLLVSRSDLSLLHWEFFKLLKVLPNND